MRGHLSSLLYTQSRPQFAPAHRASPSSLVHANARVRGHSNCVDWARTRPQFPRNAVLRPHFASSLAMAAPAWASEHLPKDPYKYMPGWGNDFSTEALPNTLPIGQNSPQVRQTRTSALRPHPPPLSRRSAPAVSTLSKSMAPPSPSRATAIFGRKASSRSSVPNACRWFYRIRPSVTHTPFQPVRRTPLPRLALIRPPVHAVQQTVAEQLQRGALRSQPAPLAALRHPRRAARLRPGHCHRLRGRCVADGPRHPALTHAQVTPR